MAGGDSAGGSLTLASLIDRHGEELAYDFQAYLGLDLRLVTRPEEGLTPRRAVAFLKQLPIESATVAAIRGGPEFRGWNADRYFMADAIDALLNIHYATVRANSKGKPKPPKPVSRPGDTAGKRDTSGAFAQTARALANRKRANTNDGTSG